MNATLTSPHTLSTAQRQELLLRYLQRDVCGYPRIALEGGGEGECTVRHASVCGRERQWSMPAPMSPQAERVLGCLLAGAAGDALGARVEFLSWDEIRRGFGNWGIRSMAPIYGRRGAITDDTQMMLFTAEGLLRAFVRKRETGSCHVPVVVHHALQRWLLTQGVEPALSPCRDGWLIEQPALWSRRAPGNTCLSALMESRVFGEAAVNDSKGCGGVMRVAPCAFLSNPFEVASETARLTHGHPTGYLAAGLFADILNRLWRQSLPLAEVVVIALQAHGGKPGMQETRRLVEYVLRLHQQGVRPNPERIADLGGGWVADEALAIGLWCALAAESLEDGIIMAVNHSGDSDSTGMIAGNVLGLIYGPQAIPERWLEALELRDVITQVALDLVDIPARYETGGEAELRRRYPGW
jgi:ADP-ribosylglycohydrolase